MMRWKNLFKKKFVKALEIIMQIKILARKMLAETINIKLRLVLIYHNNWLQENLLFIINNNHLLWGINHNTN